MKGAIICFLGGYVHHKVINLDSFPKQGLPDVFFHMSACADIPCDQLQEGQAVQFEMVSGPKGPKAENVRPA